MSSGNRSAADVSMVTRHPGQGMNSDTLFVLCGHKTHRTGATYRNPGGVGQLWLWCGACVAARKALAGTAAEA